MVGFQVFDGFNAFLDLDIALEGLEETCSYFFLSILLYFKWVFFLSSCVDLELSWWFCSRFIILALWMRKE